MSSRYSCLLVADEHFDDVREFVDQLESEHGDADVVAGDLE